MVSLLAHSITYRIAVGPQAGRKVLTLRTLPAVRVHQPLLTHQPDLHAVLGHRLDCAAPQPTVFFPLPVVPVLVRLGRARDDVIDQVGGGFCHAPGAARGPKPTPFAGETDQFAMGAVAEAVSEIRK